MTNTSRDPGRGILGCFAATWGGRSGGYKRLLLVSEEKKRETTSRSESAPPWLESGECVLCEAATDMTVEGLYRDGWLVVTDRRVLVVQAGDDHVIRQRSWREITGAEVRHSVGNSLLFLVCGEQTALFARCSLKSAGELAGAAAVIVHHLHPGHVPGPDRSERSAPGAEVAPPGLTSSRRCPRCGAVMRRGVCPDCIDKNRLLLRVLGYLRPYLPQTVLSLSLLILGGVLRMIPPYLTGRLVDDVLYPKDWRLLKVFVAALAGVHFIQAAISGVRSYVMTWVGQRVVRDLRSEVFQHLQYLSMQFYDSVRTGALMSRATNDTQHIQRFVVQSAQNLIYEAVMILGVGTVLFLYNWKLALVTLLPMPFIVYATRLFSRRIHRIYRRIWVRRALMNSVLADAIPGIAIVKSFVQEEREIRKFNHRSDEVFQRYVEASRFRSLFQPFLSFATSLGTLSVWGYGGYLVIRGAGMSTGDIVAFLYYLNQFYTPLRNVSAFSDVIQEAATASERVFEVLDTEPETKSSGSRKVLRRIKGEIEFRDVRFSYDTGEPVLEDINFRIRPGEMIGLVGPSGSGKTTMASLIPRLYDVTGGSITIDGHDIRDLDLHSLRSQIGMVLQDPLLFHGTIAENIAYGVPNASKDDIIWAAQAANAHDFIMEFPDGYDTQTGERGLRLSGGQRQRISIARAILKNPRILILDEATSSVDTETEKLIQDAIDRLIANRTTIAIAHRLSTLKNADRLLVIEKGRLVEAGTHDELMASHGVYARLVRMQAEIGQPQVLLGG